MKGAIGVPWIIMAMVAVFILVFIMALTVSLYFRSATVGGPVEIRTFTEYRWMNYLPSATLSYLSYYDKSWKALNEIAINSEQGIWEKNDFFEYFKDTYSDNRDILEGLNLLEKSINKLENKLGKRHTTFIKDEKGLIISVGLPKEYIDSNGFTSFPDEYPYNCFSQDMPIYSDTGEKNMRINFVLCCYDIIKCSDYITGPGRMECTNDPCGVSSLGECTPFYCDESTESNWYDIKAVSCKGKKGQIVCIEDVYKKPPEEKVSTCFGDSNEDMIIHKDEEITLNQDSYYNNLYIEGDGSNKGILNTGGYRIYVRGVLINEGIIRNNGGDGESGQNGEHIGGTSCSGGHGGAGGKGGAGGSLAAGADGGKGGDGGCNLGNGASGADGTSKDYSLGVDGAKGGQGNAGQGNTGNNGVGGGSGSAGRVNNNDKLLISTENGVIEIKSEYGDKQLTSPAGSGGGGGGGGTLPSSGPARITGGGAGGAGGSGGIVLIVANEIKNEGIIEAKGGKGGGGGSGYSSSGDGGGGGGGSGGVVILVYGSYFGTGNIDVSGGNGAQKGNDGKIYQFEVNNDCSVEEVNTE
jgi:uncharacterized membrane protein YgcG